MSHGLHRAAGLLTRTARLVRRDGHVVRVCILCSTAKSQAHAQPTTIRPLIATLSHWYRLDFAHPDSCVPTELDTPPESELPLGQRVAALEGRAVFLPPPEGDDEAGPSGALPEGSAKADSLAVLLTQAIRR